MSRKFYFFLILPPGELNVLGWAWNEAEVEMVFLPA
jgi:hypothetical protein